MLGAEIFAKAFFLCPWNIISGGAHYFYLPLRAMLIVYRILGYSAMSRFLPLGSRFSSEPEVKGLAVPIESE